MVGFVAGCEQTEPAPSSTSSTSARPAASASAAAARPKYGELSRAELNQRAVRLNLPLFWKADANVNHAVDPAEVTTLLFYPTAPKWVDGGKLTPEFDQAYQRLLKATGEPAPGAASGPEGERRKLVLQDLDAATPTLVSSDLRALSEGDKSFVRHMQTVAKLVDELFAVQSGTAELAAKVPADDPASQSLFRRNGGPRCATPKVESNPACSAIPGAPKPIVAVYPAELQKDDTFCAALEKHAEAKKLLAPFVVVRDGGGGKLTAVPYTEAFAAPMKAVSDELKAAAEAVQDPSEGPLKAYLGAAAQAFLDDKWDPADEAWAKMTATNSKWYVRVGPDEVYWEPCSHKAGFHLTFARINGDSLQWQDKLRPVQQEMEDALATLIGKPYAGRKVTFHLPDFIDIVLNAGDDRDPIGGTIGQSLPNWGPLVAAGRGRTVAMSNLYEDPDSRVARRKRAESLLTKETMAAYAEGGQPGLLGTILHEATHNLGPAHEYRYQGKTDDQAFGGDLASVMEELKAQSGGVYFVEFAKQKGIISAELARQSYVDDVVWALGHIARGMVSASGQRKPYSQLAAVQIGYWLDEGALRWDPNATAANGTDKGAFSIDFDKMPAATEKLMKLVGTLKATADRPGGEELTKKYVEGERVPHKVIQERVLRLPQPSFVYALEM